MRLLVTALVLVAVSGTPAFAQSVGVFPVHGTNLTQGEAEAIGSLIASAYARKSGMNVLDPEETGPAMAQQASTPDAAKQLGLTEYIEIRAVRLETRITLDATLKNAHGSTLYATNSTLTSLDDLEVVADRVADSLYRRTPIENTQTIHNVIGKEMRKPNRTFSEKVIGVRIAGVLPAGDRAQANGALGLEFDVKLEGTSYFLEVAGGFIMPADIHDRGDSEVGGLIGLLGASYYLTDTSVSPYVGGGLSPRIMFGAYNGAGLAVNAHFGLMFMRQSSSRIYAELGLDQHLLGLSTSLTEYYDSSLGTYVTSTDRVWPTELSLAVGIGW